MSPVAHSGGYAHAAETSLLYVRSSSYVHKVTNSHSYTHMQFVYECAPDRHTWCAVRCSPCVGLRPFGCCPVWPGSACTGQVCTVAFAGRRSTVNDPIDRHRSTGSASLLDHRFIRPFTVCRAGPLSCAPTVTGRARRKLALMGFQ